MGQRRRHYHSAARDPLMLGGGSACGKWLRGPRAQRSGRLLSDPLVQAVDDWCVSGVLDLALVRQRGSNCRYSDLAIAAVEIRLVAAGVIVGLRRIVLGHLLLRENSLVCLIGAISASSRWRATAAEMRSPIVTFQTERKGKLGSSSSPVEHGRRRTCAPGARGRAPVRRASTW